MTNILRLLIIGLLIASSVHAQTTTYATTSQPEDLADLILVDAMIEEKVIAGELHLVSVRTDRLGRVHEYFTQSYNGVPVRGAGLSRQQDNGKTVSVFGKVHDGIDLKSFPTISATDALVRLEEVAGVRPATGEAPTLSIMPTPLGDFVLTWSAPMMDFYTYFIDANNGELVYRMNHIYSGGIVGFGEGITGEPQKLSVWHHDGVYQSWDRLRPAELVTLDAKNVLEDADMLMTPTPAWLDFVGEDDDNEWSNSAVVAGHANLGLAYDYLFQRHGWQGMDGQNGRVFSIVSAGNFTNAFFISAPYGPQGTGTIAFGTLPNKTPLVPLDVVGHELMHGVTFSSLVARTGSPFLNTHTAIPGPTSFTVGDYIVKCGDDYTFKDAYGKGKDLLAPILCLDEEGRLTHSPTGRLALFWNQGGAINEAYSDIFGMSMEFAFHPPGDGLLHADYKGGEDANLVVRRIDSPGSIRIGPFPYPEARGEEFRFVVALIRENYIGYTGYGMRRNIPFRSSGYDYSGIHWNSTILSHAFYLAIEGGNHSSGRTVQGVGGANRAQIERAFFRAMVDLAPPYTTFSTMSTAIQQAAADLYGTDSDVYRSINEALTAVGLNK